MQPHARATGVPSALLPLPLQSLVSLVTGFQEKLSGLEEQAAQLELVGSDASKATISRSMTTVWQRWTRLRSVARGQERVLEDTAQEWRTFREKVGPLSPCPSSRAPSETQNRKTGVRQSTH